MKLASSFGHSKKTRLPPEPARECCGGFSQGSTVTESDGDHLLVPGPEERTRMR